MEPQSIPGDQSSPLWKVMLDNLPYDPLSIFVLVLVGAFIWVVVKHASFD